MSNDPLVLKCKNKAAIDKFFNENQGLRDRNISVVIPDGVTEIDRAFCVCSSLISVTIPNSVTEIGRFAFSSCSSLKSITIPDGVDEIGVFAFSCCSSLTSINISDGVTEIGEDAFYKCLSLELVVIPDNPEFHKIDGEFDEEMFRVGSSLDRHVKLINKTDYYSYVGGKKSFDSLSECAKQILNKMIALSCLEESSANKFTAEFKTNLIKDINILAIKNPKDFLSVINSDNKAFELFSESYKKNQAGFTSSENSFKTIDGELVKLRKPISDFNFGAFFEFFSPEISTFRASFKKSKSCPDTLTSIMKTLKTNERQNVIDKFEKIETIFRPHGETKYKRSNSNENGSTYESLAKKRRLD